MKWKFWKSNKPTVQRALAEVQAVRDTLTHHGILLGRKSIWDIWTGDDFNRSVIGVCDRLDAIEKHLGIRVVRQSETIVAKKITNKKK